MAERLLISRRDESVLLSNEMDKEINSAINRVLFQQKALAHIRIMNAKRHAKGAKSAIAHPNATAEMAPQNCYIIITEARKVNKEVVDMEGTESWLRLKIDTVPLIRCMGKGTERFQKMRDDFDVGNEGDVIWTQVRQLTNAHSIQERRPNRGIAASCVVFVVKGHNVPQSSVKKGIKATGVWYQVKTYPNAGPDSKCELCRGWGLIENMCANKPKRGYIPCHHRTSDHKCNVV